MHFLSICSPCRSIAHSPNFYFLSPEPKKLCDFRPIEGKILKTVDFVYQNVKSVEECREKCLSSPYRCHSFDLGDPSSPNRVCRTSHLDKYSLAHIEEAYLQVPGAITYELHSCYNGKWLPPPSPGNCQLATLSKPTLCRIALSSMSGGSS